MFGLFFSQPRISSADWWKKTQPSVSLVNRRSDTPGEKHTCTHKHTHNSITKIHQINIDIDVDVHSEVLTKKLCFCVVIYISQDRWGYGSLQEHPWVSQPADQKELCQEQMEGKFCLLQLILCGFGSTAIDYITLLQLLSQLFLEGESLSNKNLACLVGKIYLSTAIYP